MIISFYSTIQLILNRSARYTNWVGAMFMRFGASCCPTWDPSNFISRRMPTIMSLWIRSRPPNENEKLLRTASEEEIFKKKPKRKVKKRRKSADDSSGMVVVTAENTDKSKQTADLALKTSVAAAAVADVINGANVENSESLSSLSEAGIKPRKRRSRREQAALAAKSCRGGKTGYIAANLRRYAAEKKNDQGLKQDKSSSTTSSTTTNMSQEPQTNDAQACVKGT